MICCLFAESAGVSVPAGVLESVARACSPRVVPHGDDAVIFDADGLSRVCGPPEVIAREVQGMAATHGLTVRVAVADSMTAVWVLAHAKPGITVVPAGEGRTALSTLPVSWLGTVFDLDRAVEESGERGVSPVNTAGPAGLASTNALRRGRRSGGRHDRVAPPSPPAPTASVARPPNLRTADRQRLAQCRDRLATLERWGIRTCGDLAALARADIYARMGPVGVRLHQASLGEDVAPLVPVDEATVFVDRVELEWPIDGLEPLSFVLARQCDRLSTDLERADRGAVTLHTTLRLVTRETHTRSLALPAPLRDARVLRMLILIDLESHPPRAAIDVVELRLDVTPGRILQGSLLTLSVPTPEDLSTLIARLGALMGEARIGAPVRLDTHDARHVALKPFQIPKQRAGLGGAARDLARARNAPPLHWATLRRFRLPLSVRVTVEHGMPVCVMSGVRDLVGGRVVASAGPWRSSGAWWTGDRAAWDRDEWDVELVAGVVYRLARLRPSGAWEIEGVFD